MAEFTVSATLGGATASFSVSPSNTRMTEFLDDLRNLHYPQVDDGAGGTRVMTRAEAATRWINDLGRGQVEFARGLEQRRLNADVPRARDLEGNA